jgi:hypothetical protein
MITTLALQHVPSVAPVVTVLLPLLPAPRPRLTPLQPAQAPSVSSVMMVHAPTR